MRVDARRSKQQRYELGARLSSKEMTEYCLRHRLRDSFGIREEEEIKQTISYAADCWVLEKIDLTAFSYIADPTYRNRSMKAHPILLHFNTFKGERYSDVLDGKHRIGMARAQRKKTLLAWVGHLEEEMDTRGRVP